MRKALGLLLVLAALSGVVRADERHEIRQLFPKTDRVDTLKTVEGWGWVTVDYAGNGGGTYIVHRLVGRWRIMGGGGGALVVGDAARLGLPRRYWSQLLPYHPSARDTEEAAHQGPAWPETSQRLVTKSYLEFRSGWELTLMRNEILARRGRSFKDAELRAYFLGKAWYRPDPAYSDARLTAVERGNIQFLLAYQKQHHLLAI